jgi:hypothetical protein
MMKLMTLLPLAAVSLGVQVIVAAAQDVPTFDVSQTCRGESQAEPDATFKICMADEQKAREMLVSQWRQFAPANRTTCTQTETDIAGVRSYVELLTCLQMARDARGLPEE